MLIFIAMNEIVMLQQEKEFLNNYISNLKINPVIKVQEMRFHRCIVFR